MRGHDWWRRIILIGVGLVLLGLAISSVGPKQIAAQMAEVGPGVVWIFVAYGVATSVGAFPWAWLLPSDMRPSVGSVLASRFAASGANAVLPFFGLGGEPSRLLWLSPQARPLGLAAIVVDRLLYNAASGLFLLLGAITVLGGATIPTSYAVVAALGAAAIILATLVLAWLVPRMRLGGRLDALWCKLKRRNLLAQASSEEAELGSQIDASISRLMKSSPSLLASALLAHFAGRVLLAVEVWVALYVLGAPTDLQTTMVLAAAPILLSVVASWVPSHIGVQESAFALVAVLLGLPAAVGVALVLLQRVRQVVFVSLGGLLISSMAAQRT